MIASTFLLRYVDLMQTEHTRPKRVIILGATGSIGDSTLRVIDASPETFEVVGLSAHGNQKKLAELAVRYRPQAIAITQQTEIHLQLQHQNITTYCGDNAALALLDHEADIVVAAMVGAAGIVPVMKALQLGRTVIFANKEALVCAGALMMDACKQSGGKLLPADSEHNAIFQSLQGSDIAQISHITLTASGGPFLTLPMSAFASITPEQAVKHPKWSMGAKISVDSATMMNKGLELIEARWLFDLPESRIDVVIHPEAILHGFVQYQDGSVIGQMGEPDMVIPLSYCMHYPQRGFSNKNKLDLAKIAAMHFYDVDTNRFPALALARAVLNSSMAASIAFNAANEIAVAAFLQRKIAYGDIVPHVARAVEHFSTESTLSIEDVLALDARVRSFSETQVMKAA